MNFTIRELRPNDINFVYATWTKSQYYGCSYFKPVPKEAFMAAFQARIQAILGQPDTQVLVACLNEDEDVVLGYAVITPYKALHYVFIKKAWRGMGLATALTGGASTCVITHMTDLLDLKKKDLIFNPFLLPS
jgi:RimJ/RimL family protein N-acetyltransferase